MSWCRLSPPHSSPVSTIEKFLVHFEQQALKSLLNITKLSSCLTWSRLRLSKLDLEVRKKNSKDNQHAHYLSLLLKGSLTAEDDEDDIPSFLLGDVDANAHLETIDFNATVDFIEIHFD